MYRIRTMAMRTTSVLRGGSFFNRARNTRCANRNRNRPENRNRNNGFRCVRGSGRQHGVHIRGRVDTMQDPIGDRVSARCESGPRPTRSPVSARGLRHPSPVRSSSACATVRAGLFLSTPPR
ncbi:SUMF1/EgtB/PvdO family nonheme iron enzyme [Haliangium sp.]|uniref:SUMF1/EgtB/PvdO family nonheme iron enzyme n=1 Tax=Haliangium sp. TaxID=2663208 RepID=UPI003D0F4F7C